MYIYIYICIYIYIYIYIYICIYIRYVANSKLNLNMCIQKRCIHSAAASNGLLSDNRYMSGLRSLCAWKCIPTKYSAKSSHAHVMLRAFFSICEYRFWVSVNDLDS